MAEKSKYWTCVCYLENMREDWKESIYDLFQLPFAYCVHDKDNLKDGKEERKAHVHILLAFNNTTTYNNAFSIFEKLNADNMKAFNKIERVHNIRYCYNYLIHDTEKCKKDNKYLYDRSERICGNNFDIGAFEQLSQNDKLEMIIELTDYIINNGIMNYLDFYMAVLSDFEKSYLEVLIGHQGHFEKCCKANFLKNSK